MDKGNRKTKNQKTPVENHGTAAWANIESCKDVSNVTIPSEMQIDNAKDYVDDNEK